MEYRTITSLLSLEFKEVFGGWLNWLHVSTVSLLSLMSFQLHIHIHPRHVAPLSSHLESQNVEFIQFAFRWMNCLLMREISVRNTIRMWDTYLVSQTHHSCNKHQTHCSVDRKGRGPRCILAIPSLRLLRFPSEMERETASNGFSGIGIS
jgi:hypothetical protein